MFSKQSNHLSLDILFNSLDSKICCGLKNNYHCVIIRIIPLYCCSKQCCYFNTSITQKKNGIMLRFFHLLQKRGNRKKWYFMPRFVLIGTFPPLLFKRPPISLHCKFHQFLFFYLITFFILYPQKYCAFTCEILLYLSD